MFKGFKPKVILWLFISSKISISIAFAAGALAKVTASIVSSGKFYVEQENDNKAINAIIGKNLVGFIRGLFKIWYV